MLRNDVEGHKWKSKCQKLEGEDFRKYKKSKETTMILRLVA